MTHFGEELGISTFRFEGAYYPSKIFQKENLESFVSMVVRDDDVILASYPRSGSTWTQTIIWSILNAGAPLPEYLKIEFPTVEFLNCALHANKPSPRAFKCHLPYRTVPKSVNARYVCIVRNMYDTCLSAEAMFKSFGQQAGLLPDQYLSRNSHVRHFAMGTLPLGDYFEICQSWFERKDDANVCFLTFEDMKRNAKEAVMTLAEFLGPKYLTSLRRSPEVVSNILRNTSVESMRESKSYRFPKLNLSSDLAVEKEDGIWKLPVTEINTWEVKNFIREGVVGKGTECLTLEQKEVLEHALTERIKYEELRDTLARV